MVVDVTNRIDYTRLSKQQKKEREFFASLTESFIWLRAKARSGKTATLVSIAYNLREYFNKTPILDFKPYDNFGYYEYMDVDAFIETQHLFSKLVKEGVFDGLDGKELRAAVKQETKYDLIDATIGLDEAYKNLWSRQPTKQEVLAYNSFCQTYGHYHMTVIIISPFKNQIDKDAARQVKVELNCSYDPQTMLVMAKGLDRDTLEEVRLITPIRKYGEMYNSWSPQAILQRRKIEVGI